MTIWDVITNLQGTTLKTLDQSKSFDVVHVGEREVVVQPHASGSPRHIRRSDIEDAFNQLVQQRELTRSDIRARFSNFNPAYVSALIAEHPNVTATRKPITLRYTAD